MIDEEQPLADDGQWPVLGLQASELAPGEAEAFAEDADVGGEAAIGEGESADQPSPATVNQQAAADAAPGTAEPVRFFEMEDAPGQAEGHADIGNAGAVTALDDVEADAAEGVASEPEAAEAAAATVAEESADALDFSVYDRELVDIFVEEGKDLLDHCDGLISELRDAPQDREVLVGLQRDLHTLKGGARMAGINAIGDLGHSIESLLEAVAAGRTDIERRDVQLLERGFDRLHQLLTRTGDHRVVEPAQDLVDAFEVRTTTDIAAAAAASAAAAAAANEATVAETAQAPDAVPAPALLDAPLSAPLLDRRRGR